MLKGFYTKKIKTAETLSERLKSAREKMGATLAEAEIATKVRSKFLLALESNNWSALPSAPYVRGFVCAYVKYLELDSDETLKLFEAELLLRKKNESVNISYKNSIKEVKFLITPKFIGYFLLALFVVGMFSYIGYQVLSFAGAPDLRVTAPSNNSVLDKELVNILGTTDKDIALSVNDEDVQVGSDGHFNASLKLHQGINIVKVTAINKAQKESSEVLTLEYMPKVAEVSFHQN